MRSNYFAIKLCVFLLCITCCQSPDVAQGNISDNSKGQSERFYDFAIEVKLYRDSYGHIETIEYDPDKSDFKQGFRITHYKYWNLTTQTKLEEPLMQDYRVSEGKLDEIYAVVAKAVSLPYPLNKSEYEVPPPPIRTSEWEYCTIELDLRFRGEKHMVKTGDQRALNSILALSRAE